MPSIVSGINSIFRNLAVSDDFDPKNIPAKLHLSDLGEISYSASVQDVLGGAVHQVVADDPNRTFYYTRTNSKAFSPKPIAPKDLVTSEHAISAMLCGVLGGASFVGACVLTLPAASAIFYLASFGFLVAALLFAAPKEPRNAHTVNTQADTLA